MTTSAHKTEVVNRTKSVRFPTSSFTGKERDAETGYSYFGARYYDSDLSGLFLSVDPMSDKYPSISPYAYCAWSPIKLIDPCGYTIVISNNGENVFYQKGLQYGGEDAFISKTIGYLNDMGETPEGEKVLDKLIGSGNKYTYTSLSPSNGKAAFRDDNLNFEMGNADNYDYAHETFHAYQNELGMRGKTATREVGARLFQSIMCDKIKSWGIRNPMIPLNGKAGTNYTDSMLELFLSGFNVSAYTIVCKDFLDQSLAGPDYKNSGYTVGQILQNPPIREILNINQACMKKTQ